MLFFQDELIGVAEKSVLRVPDLLDWLANPKTLNWDRLNINVIIIIINITIKIIMIINFFQLWNIYWKKFLQRGWKKYQKKLKELHTT